MRASAEGATAPETLRPQGPMLEKHSGEIPDHVRDAEGITISGKKTEGASRRIPFGACL